MAREPRDRGANIEEVFENGHSGSYPSPYLSGDDLRRLLARCQGTDKLICNIEAYEIDGEFDAPRIDLGLYAGSSAEQLKPWGDRVAATTEFIERLIEDAAREQNPIMFVVWLDTKTAP